MPFDAFSLGALYPSSNGTHVLPFWHVVPFGKMGKFHNGLMSKKKNYYLKLWANISIVQIIIVDFS